MQKLSRSDNSDQMTSQTKIAPPVQQVTKKKASASYSGLCGILGGSAGILVTHPIDTVRVRVILQRKSFLSLMKEIFHKNGILGFFSGVIPPVTIRGLAFGTNRFFFSKGRELSDIPFIQGCIAGIPNAVIECPMHFLKIRSQVLDGTSRNPETLTFYIKHSYKILRYEGIRAYFRGFLCNLVVMVPGFGLFYLAYEPLKSEYGISPFLASVLSVPVTWVPVYPLEVLRSHYQTDLNLTYKNAVRNLFQPFSLQKCFPGITTTLNRAVLRFAVAMSVTEWLEKKAETWDWEKHSHDLQDSWDYTILIDLPNISGTIWRTRLLQLCKYGFEEETKLFSIILKRIISMFTFLGIWLMNPVLRHVTLELRRLSIYLYAPES